MISRPRRRLSHAADLRRSCRATRNPHRSSSWWVLALNSIIAEHAWRGQGRACPVAGAGRRALPVAAPSMPYSRRRAPHGVVRDGVSRGSGPRCLEAWPAAARNRGQRQGTRGGTASAETRAADAWLATRGLSGYRASRTPQRLM